MGLEQRKPKGAKDLLQSCRGKNLGHVLVVLRPLAALPIKRLRREISSYSGWQGGRGKCKQRQPQGGEGRQDPCFKRTSSCKSKCHLLPTVNDSHYYAQSTSWKLSNPSQAVFKVHQSYHCTVEGLPRISDDVFSIATQDVNGWGEIKTRTSSW